jgi:hypothetical protein
MQVVKFKKNINNKHDKHNEHNIKIKKIPIDNFFNSYYIKIIQYYNERKNYCEYVLNINPSFAKIIPMSSKFIFDCLQKNSFEQDETIIKKFAHLFFVKNKYDTNSLILNKYTFWKKILFKLVTYNFSLDSLIDRNLINFIINKVNNNDDLFILLFKSKLKYLHENLISELKINIKKIDRMHQINIFDNIVESFKDNDIIIDMDKYEKDIFIKYYIFNSINTSKNIEKYLDIIHDKKLNSNLYYFNNLLKNIHISMNKVNLFNNKFAKILQKTFENKIFNKIYDESYLIELNVGTDIIKQILCKKKYIKKIINVMRIYIDKNFNHNNIITNFLIKYKKILTYILNKTSFSKKYIFRKLLLQLPGLIKYFNTDHDLVQYFTEISPFTLLYKNDITNIEKKNILTSLNKSYFSGICNKYINECKSQQNNIIIEQIDNKNIFVQILFKKYGIYKNIFPLLFINNNIEDYYIIIDKNINDAFIMFTHLYIKSLILVDNPLKCNNHYFEKIIINSQINIDNFTDIVNNINTDNIDNNSNISSSGNLLYIHNVKLYCDDNNITLNIKYNNKHIDFIIKNKNEDDLLKIEIFIDLSKNNIISVNTIINTNDILIMKKIYHIIYDMSFMDFMTNIIKLWKFINLEKYSDEYYNMVDFIIYFINIDDLDRYIYKNDTLRKYSHYYKNILKEYDINGDIIINYLNKIKKENNLPKFINNNCVLINKLKSLGYMNYLINNKYTELTIQYIKFINNKNDITMIIKDCLENYNSYDPSYIYIYINNDNIFNDMNTFTICIDRFNSDGIHLNNNNKEYHKTHNYNNLFYEYSFNKLYKRNRKYYIEVLLKKKISHKLWKYILNKNGLLLEFVPKNKKCLTLCNIAVNENKESIKYIKKNKLRSHYIDKY